MRLWIFWLISQPGQFADPEDTTLCEEVIIPPQILNFVAKRTIHVMKS